jgi:hypothetical protein
MAKESHNLGDGYEKPHFGNSFGICELRQEVL